MKHKVPRRKNPALALAYDLGGTKVLVGVVNDKGKVLEDVRVPVVIQEGKAAVIQQLAELGNKFLKHYPSIKRVGMASAGPLDPGRGLLLDPTNFKSEKGTWGKVPIARLLSQKLKRPVLLENDAAAAMLAEHWIGKAKGFDNAMILTLGTGLGTGVIANGKLQRAGRQLHPEGGHLILHHSDTTAPCGCGNLGCAEAYLSGVSFTRRAQARFGNPDLTSQAIADLARKMDPRAMAAFDEYSMMMALAIHCYVVIYAPEIVVFTGSFAATSDLFLEPTRQYLEKLLLRRRVGVDLMPKLAVSALQNRAGLIGASHVALHRE